MDLSNIKKKAKAIKGQVKEKMEDVDTKAIFENASELLESSKKKASETGSEMKSAVNDIKQGNISAIFKNKIVWAIGGITLLLLIVLFTSGEAIITKECVMNGRGEGTCSFTNTGTAEGEMCGRIFVETKDGKKNAESNIFCSGKIPVNTTVNVSFNVPQTQVLCGVSSFEQELVYGFSAGLGSINWTDKCDFYFVEK